MIDLFIIKISKSFYCNKIIRHKLHFIYLKVQMKAVKSYFSPFVPILLHGSWYNKSDCYGIGLEYV